MIYIGDVTIYEYVNIGTNNGKSAIIGDYATINSRVCIVGTNVCFSYIKVGECSQHQHQCSTITVCELITLF